MTTGPDRQTAFAARRIAIVLVVTMVLWMGAQWLGGSVGLPLALAFVFDLLALAAFGWALFSTYQIWRKRRDE